jgi:hypothetical protein
MNRTILKTASLCLLAAGLTFVGCKDDENPSLSLTSATAGSTDLNGATSATGVLLNTTIVATFSTTVDPASVTTSTITLKAASTNTNAALTFSTSGSTVTIDPSADLNGGDNYTLSFAGLMSNEGEAMPTTTLTFKTAGVGYGTAPQASSQVMYLQMNGNITDLTSNATASFTQVGYTTDRFGKANSAAMFNGGTAPGNGDIVELTGTKFVNASTTISTWFQADLATFGPGSRIMFGCATERGYFMEVAGDMAWCKLATSHMLNPDPNNHYFGTAWTDPNGDGQVNSTTGGQTTYDYTGSIASLMQNTWHQLAMTFDAATGVKTIFIDGMKVMQVDVDLNTTEWYLKDMKIADKADGTGAAITGIDPKLTLGYFCSRANTATGWSDYTTSTNTFKGAMDDFRIWNKALTEAEVTSLYNAEKP